MSDKRLIDANALMKELEGSGFGDHSLIESVLAAGVYAVIENAPTVDAVEVVRGRWIYERIYQKCSLCEWIFCVEDCEGDSQKFSYCPNCGAKMDAKDMNVLTKDGGAEG